ncbi:hypothetical protein [Streptomyces sp. NPDC001221]
MTKHHVNPPTTRSAALHAERIRAAEEERTASERKDGRQTYEVYAERALEQARADEELREGARMRELQARGVISAAEDLDEEDEEFEPEDEEEKPPSTAERYAAVELKRREAEHQANLVAHRGAVQTIGATGHRHAAQLAQPHRQAHLWQKPAS